MVQELYTTKNAIIDKNGDFEALFSRYMGRSFIFSRIDEEYKAKRKACAHAFYKEKLVKMLETIKDKIGLYCEKWTAEIEASGDGSTTIDMA